MVSVHQPYGAPWGSPPPWAGAETGRPPASALLLGTRAFCGRVASAPGEVSQPRSLAPVALREQVPAIALSFGVLVLGLAPELLANLSEAATTGLSQLSGGLS